jgi:hypothetical protein
MSLKFDFRKLLGMLQVWLLEAQGSPPCIR